MAKRRSLIKFTGKRLLKRFKKSSTITTSSSSGGSGFKPIILPTTSLKKKNKEVAKESNTSPKITPKHRRRTYSSINNEVGVKTSKGHVTPNEMSKRDIKSFNKKVADARYEFFEINKSFVRPTYTHETVSAGNVRKIDYLQKKGVANWDENDLKTWKSVEKLLKDVNGKSFVDLDKLADLEYEEYMAKWKDRLTKYQESEDANEDDDGNLVSGKSDVQREMDKYNRFTRDDFLSRKLPRVVDYLNIIK